MVLKQALTKNEKSFLTKSELQLVEDYADKLFKDIGIDIEFTKHFSKE